MEEEGRVPGGEGVGEGSTIFKHESLEHFLDLTFLTFLFLFLPQMNWVSITGRSRGEAKESQVLTEGDLGLPCW